jgi:hypothetical protein
MTRCAFVLLALAPLAVAAPVPKDTERQKIEKLYGKIVDPKGDSKFELDGSKLKITLPANEVRTFSYTTDPDDPNNSKKYKKTNDTPRVEFTAKGDFVLTVRITTPLDADADPPVGKGEVFLGGGVQLIPKDEGWVRGGYGRMHSPRRGCQNLMPFEAPNSWGKHGFSTSVVLTNTQPDSFLFRATRQADRVALEVSEDGKSWGESVAIDQHLTSDELTLALFAQHASSKARTVTFSEFEVKPIKK